MLNAFEPPAFHLLPAKMNSLMIQSHNILQLDKVIGITNPHTGSMFDPPAGTVRRASFDPPPPPPSSLVSSISPPTRRRIYLTLAVIPTCCSRHDRLMIRAHHCRRVKRTKEEDRCVSPSIFRNCVSNNRNSKPLDSKLSLFVFVVYSCDLLLARS